MPRPRTVDGPAEKLTVMIPADLARTIRIMAAAENRAIADLVGQALREWVGLKVRSIRKDTDADDMLRVALDSPAKKKPRGG